MLPNDLELGSLAVLSNLVSIASYLLTVIAGTFTAYYMFKFLRRENKTGNLSKNRLLTSVALVIAGTVVASLVHLVSRAEYVLRTDSLMVPFSSPWVVLLFTLGHLALALAMVNFLVVFYQDAGITLFSWGNRRKKSGGNTDSKADGPDQILKI